MNRLVNVATGAALGFLLLAAGFLAGVFASIDYLNR